MRAGWRVALAGASLASALVAACSLESLSGLTGGQGSGDAGETANAPGEAGPSDDATTETGMTNDAPPGVDAVAETGGGRDAAHDARPDGPHPEAGPWCQTHAHFFCSDWDEGSLNAQWTSIYSMGEGGVALDTSAFSSPPASFVATVPALAAGDQSHQALVHQFPFTANSLDIAFDLRIDSLDTSTAAQPTETLAVVFGTGSNPYALQLNLVVGNTQLGEQVPSGTTHTYDGWPLSIQPTVGVWTHYVIHVDLSATAPSASLWMNDAGVVSHALSGFVQGDVVLQMGVCYTPGATTGTQVHYDNVTLDYQ